MLPSFLEHECDGPSDPRTLYYSFFWDSDAKELRPICFQLNAPGHLLEFLAHNTIVSSGGGERNLALLGRSVMKGMREFCERWRTRTTSPKRKVKIEVDVDLEHLLCLPFSMLVASSFDAMKAEFRIPALQEELDEILGEEWMVVESKARRVVDGEVLQFRFSSPLGIVHNWEKSETRLLFEGVSMYNGAGVLQWSTLTNPAQGWLPLCLWTTYIQVYMFAFSNVCDTCNQQCH